MDAIGTTAIATFEGDEGAGGNTSAVAYLAKEVSTEAYISKEVISS
jgi:hypothetical protein